MFLANVGFTTLVGLVGENQSKFCECDKCHTKSISSLPFSNLSKENWLIFNDLKTSNTSDDVNIMSAHNEKFATLNINI